MEKDAEMLDALFQYATEGIVVANQMGEIVLVNPRIEKLFGYSHSELIGNKIEILIPSRFKKKHVSHRDNYFHSPHARPMGMGMTLFAKRKDDSEFPVEVSLSHYVAHGKKFAIAFLTDITERNKQEDIIRKANQELSQYSNTLEKRVEQKTEALASTINELAKSQQDLQKALSKERELNELKSRFVTTASHEFRTPLATILSSTSLIARYDKPEDAEKRQKHIDRIKSSISNLTEILNDFLSLGKLEEGLVRNNPEEFEIVSFAQSIVDEMKNITKENQQIIFSHHGKNSSVAFDRQLLKNVILNLLSNAIKYSPAGKNIEFKTHLSGRMLLISIVDGGIGIPEEDQKHLFERFFRAKNSTNIQGTGLGLNIVKKYVELMNGNVTFASTLNEGTTFTVRLPIEKGKISAR